MDDELTFDWIIFLKMPSEQENLPHPLPIKLIKNTKTWPIVKKNTKPPHITLFLIYFNIWEGCICVRLGNLGETTIK